MKGFSFLSIYILLFTFLVFSCSQKTTPIISSNNQDAYSKEKMDTLLVKVEEPKQTNKSQLKTLPTLTPKVYIVAGLEKTECYGNCPSYKFQIYSNGEAVYEGRKFVKRFGKFVANIDETTILFIKEKADELDMAELKSTYPSNGVFLNDLPMTITSLMVERKDRIIRNNYDAPKELLEFEQFLEDLIEIIEWRREDAP